MLMQVQAWHPTLRRLVQAETAPTAKFGGEGGSSSSSSAASASSCRVDEIWLFDDIHHAASIDLNAGRIGGVHGWNDGGRDIVNFLRHVYRGVDGAYPDGSNLNWKKKARGDNRIIIGVGHSVGANAL
jgi:hypothetical protein